jgi:hypothetical protein
MVINLYLFLKSVLFHVAGRGFDFDLVLDFLDFRAFGFDYSVGSQRSFSKIVLGVKSFGSKGGGRKSSTHIVFSEVAARIFDSFLIRRLHESRVLLCISGR